MRRVWKLDTIGNIRSEMARIYRLCASKQLESAEGARLTYMLREIRACVEAMTLQQVLERIETLQALADQKKQEAPRAILSDLARPLQQIN